MSSTHGCFVCYAVELEPGSALSSRFPMTSTTETPVLAMLERMLGYSVTAEVTDDDFVCASCVDRFNEYDEACQTAQRVERDLIKLFSTKPVLKEEAASYDAFIVEDEGAVEVETKYEQYEGVDESQSIIIEILNEVEKDKFEKDEVIQPNISRTATCTQCKKTLPSVGALRRHPCSQMEKPFVCDICGHRYKSKSALSIHMVVHSGGSTHSCSICQKTFTQRGALTRHMPIHTGEKPYQCDKCGKQFIHYSSFHMHKLAHDDIRQQVCNICGLELRSTSHLSRHMRVHSGEKPHACPKCGQKFAQRYNMMAHFKAHQGIHRVITKNHKCSICECVFAKPCLLRDHMANKHGATQAPPINNY